MKTEILFRCPFCGRWDSVGAVAIDLHGLLRASRAGAPPISEEVEWSPDESRQVFIFNPDGSPNRPCPHVISFVMDAWVNVFPSDDPDGDGDKFERPVSHSITWDHPWFAENDPDQHLEVYLWTELEPDAPTAFDPPTRYEIVPVERKPWVRSFRKSRRRRELYVGGTIIVALDATRFLDELRTGVARRYEFEARAAAGSGERP